MASLGGEFGSNLTDLVFQVSLDPILLATLAECIIVNVNQAFCEASEYQRQEIIGFTSFDLRLWAFPEEHNKLIKRLQEYGSVRDFEADLQTKSGLIRRVLLSAQIFEHNQEALILINIKDISDRLEQERTYRLLFESNPTPMWIYAMDTLQFLEVNDAAIAHYGYSKSEFLTMTIADIRPPEDIPALKQTVKDLANGRSSEVIAISEWRHRKQDGTVFEVEINSHLIHWQGKASSFVIAKDISARKRVEQELNNSWNLINSHFDNSPLAVIQWDQNHRIVGWSKQAETMFGWTAEEIADMDYDNWQFVYEEDFNRVASEIRELYNQNTKTQVQVENRNYRKDGSIITCEWHSSTIFDTEGNLVSVLSFAQDISDRKRNEQALLKSQNILNASQKLAKVGGWSYNPLSQESFWTEEVYNIFDLPLDFEINLPTNLEYLTNFYAEMAERVKGLFLRAIEQGESYDLESPLITAQGQHLWVRTTANTIKEDGRVVNIIGTVMDITEQKLSEQQLSNSLQLLNIHLDNSPLAVIEWDENLRLTQWSKQAEVMFGWKKDEVINRDFYTWKFIHEDDFEQVMSGVLEPYSKGKNLQILNVNRNYTKDGTVITCEWYNSAVFDDEGKLISILSMVQNISDRKLQENQIRETQAFLNSIIDNIPSMIFVKDAKDFRYTLVNKAAEKFIGIAKSEVLGKNDHDLFIKENADLCLSHDLEAIANRKIIDIPEELVSSNDQGIRRFQTRIVPIMDEDSNPKFVLNVCDDISDLKQMEQFLQQKLKQEQMIFEISNRIRRDLDLSSIISTTVIELREALQCDRVVIYKFNPDWSGNIVAESVSKEWDALISELENGVEIISDQNFIQNDRCYVNKLRNSNSSESLSLKDTYLKDTQGGNYSSGTSYLCVKDIYTMGFSQCYIDLLELLSARAYITTPIYEGEKLWGLLASYQNSAPRNWQDYEVAIALQIASQLGISVKQAELFTQIKQRSDLQKILTYISSEYINIPVSELETTINRSLQELGQFVEADRSYIFEYDWLRKGCRNTHEWCAPNISPQIHNLQNVPLAMIAEWLIPHKNGQTVTISNVYDLAEDNSIRELLEPQSIKSLITIPMMAGNECIGFVGFDSVQNHHIYSNEEESLLRVFSQIIVNVNQRAATEKVLIAEKRKAEASTLAKSEFLAMMSHEIRTPMNAVIGMTELLSLTALEPEQQDFVETIRTGGESLLSVINDILDFSKIEANGLELAQEPFSLRTCLESIISLLLPKATEKNLVLTSSIDRRVPDTLIGDANRLRQIMINLIGNSLKFTETGSIKIEIKLIAKEGINCNVKFSVIDTGIGIDSDRLEKLFQPFQQGDSSITRRYGGTGLGLVISRRLCECMGGTMEVKSSLGQGSNFSFDIIFRQSLLPIEAEILLQTSIQLDPSIRILLVEDNVVNQKVAKTMLKKLGYDIEVANNGIEALERMKIQTFDLIFMDMQMPEMDGVTTTKRIRRDFSPELQPQIIAMTANAMVDSMQECFSAGMDDFISKPVTKDALIKAIAKLFPYN